jgi:hypothetical protein
MSNGVVQCRVTGALNQSSVRIGSGDGIESHLEEGSAIQLGWSNVRFGFFDEDWDDGFLDPALIPGSNPVELMLQFLLSTGKGSESSPGPNGAYDVFEPGVGLGIPLELVDVSSFEDLLDPASNYDFDVNQRVFFIFTEPEPAKPFLERELCRPFGYYLATRNDGRIRLIRPRHPQKFYVGGSNRRLATKSPASDSTIAETSIEIGVYDANEIVAAINAADGFPGELSYASGYFSLRKKSGNDFAIVPGAQNAIWRTLGWTAQTTISSSWVAAPSPRGQIPAEIAARTLTKDDLWNVRVLDNRSDRVTSVSFHYDFDISSGSFLSFRRYADAESMHLNGLTSSHDFTIRSRGLISGTNGKAWINHPIPDQLGCRPKKKLSSIRWSVEADTWTRLHAKSLLDRYKNPPMKFSAKLKWKWNTLEVGDVVRINYDIPGVFLDFERNATTLTNRLFEIVRLEPQPDGSIEATFLGHRWVSY